MSRHFPNATPADVLRATGAVEMEHPLPGRSAACCVRILSHELGAVVVLDAGDDAQALIATLPTLVAELTEEFDLPVDQRQLWVLDHHHQSEIAGPSPSGVRDGFTRIHIGRGNHSEGNCAWEPIGNPRLGYQRVAALLGEQFAEWYPHLVSLTAHSAQAQVG